MPLFWYNRYLEAETYGQALFSASNFLPPSSWSYPTAWQPNSLVLWNEAESHFRVDWCNKMCAYNQIQTKTLAENPCCMLLSGMRLEVEKNIVFRRNCNKTARFTEAGISSYISAFKCWILYSGLQYFHYLSCN